MPPEPGHTRHGRHALVERRISDAAKALVEAHGLHGFTMERLARRAGVSRRTLFNHVPSKIDAVLGMGPTLPDRCLVTFVDGGPSGHLMTDLAHLSTAYLESREQTQEDVARLHQIISASPHLRAAVRERFVGLRAGLVELVEQREGSTYGRDRAELAAAVAATLFDRCVSELLEGGEPSASLAATSSDRLVLARDVCRR